jgi:hypothetical protein
MILNKKIPLNTIISTIEKKFNALLRKDGY